MSKITTSAIWNIFKQEMYTTFFISIFVSNITKILHYLGNTDLALHTELQKISHTYRVKAYCPRAKDEEKRGR